jgi:UDP-N-acetylmuramate dehydrogenase
MDIKNNISLKQFNTFGVDVKAKFLTFLEKEVDIKEVFDSEEFKNNPHIFLGEGSNVLFVNDFEGIVVVNKLKGIEILREDEENVWLKIASGEGWHDIVLFTVEKKYWGIENMALIPGTVGAAPIQNIGAYGVEIKDVIEDVFTFNIETSEKKIFSKDECKFGYRESVFKNELKDKYFISAIVIKLSKVPKINLSYKALNEYIEKNNIEKNNIKNISDSVIAIRQSKLPDPKVVGSAGSFFKNVFVEKDILKKILEKFPELPYFEEGDVYKIPAGWLIESCNLKGKVVGNTGVYEHQALVIVNHGGATGFEIKNLVDQIINSVEQKFGLTLVPEVNII